MKGNNLETHLFMDYEKIIDCTHRYILFDMLKSRNIPDTLIKAKVNIYTQNKILIKFNSKLSKLPESNKGVCQVVLSYLHCLIYTLMK
jgi:hypothetical protein